MKIAIDARYIGGRPTGIGRYTLNLLRGIAAARPPFPIIVLASPGQPIPEDIRASSCLEVIATPGNPHALRNQIAFPAFLRRIGAGLLHSTDVFAPVLARCIQVVNIHDLIPLACRDLLRASLKGRLLPLWRAWLKLQCRAASAIVTGSRHTAADIERLLRVPPRKVRVIPDGVDKPAPADDERVRDIRQRFSLKERIALYVGRRDPYKNIVGLLRAFGRVRAASPIPVQLVIAGAPDPRYPEPEREVQRLGLADSVVFAGYVGDEDLAALYATADVFVFPSLYEGYGLPPLEAMSHGVPVVASNRTSVPEVLGDAALLVDPARDEELASAILRVLSDGALASRLRRAGLARAASLSLRELGEATLQLYREIVGH